MRRPYVFGLLAGFGAFAMCSLTIASLGTPMMYYAILCCGCPAVGFVCGIAAMQEDGE